MIPAAAKIACTALALAAASLGAAPATAEITPFALGLAAAAADDDDLSAYYRDAGYDPLWVGSEADDRDRRAALLAALGGAETHGLPAGRYDADRVRRALRDAATARDRARLEVELSTLFLRFAADLQSGILEPGEVVAEIRREAPRRDRQAILRDLSRVPASAFMAGLAPGGQEYARLIGAKHDLEAAIRAGGWGEPVRASRLERGDTGPEVVALRDRLVAMGYMAPSALPEFDARLERAVTAFQGDHGLAADGIAGDRTLRELNASPERRLGQVLVAMERERWMNRDLGDAHIWVNLTDFHARIVVGGETRFRTRSVIGKREHQTPEFSDTMDHMVINPYWYVPRSIVVEEYLPDLRRNPRAHGQLQILDRQGRVVGRNQSFARYSARDFPYSMRQEPGPSNALGRVKFMFPNRYNIYLHDTPSQHLFSEPVRAFSHGCIRLDEPYDFARALLRLDGDADPEGTFRRHLQSGDNRRVDLSDPLPVHLVYRTAMAKPDGGMEYRDDIYGRDARILDALMTRGVRIPGLDRQLALSTAGD